jgi:hypothetical protein
VGVDREVDGTVEQGWVVVAGVVVVDGVGWSRNIHVGHLRFEGLAANQVAGQFSRCAWM